MPLGRPSCYWGGAEFTPMLELAVFLRGAMVMILELGTSLVVWTSLIGVILGSMSREP